MKKRIFAFFVLYCILLSGCGQSTQGAVSSSSASTDLFSSASSLQPDASSPLTEPTAEIVFEDLQVWRNALGATCATYTAEIKNTSSSTVSLKNSSIDIEKPDGSLLKSTDFFSINPRVVAPGESAYISKDIVNDLDQDITADQIGKAILHYDVEVHPDFEPLPVEITELSLGKQYSYPKFIGRIENIGTEDLKNIYIAAPIRDANGQLQAVGFTIVQSLSAGEKKGFEQTCMGAATNLDYSQSSVSAIAYDGSLF